MRVLETAPRGFSAAGRTAWLLPAILAAASRPGRLAAVSESSVDSVGCPLCRSIQSPSAVGQRRCAHHRGREGTEGSRNFPLRMMAPLCARATKGGSSFPNWPSECEVSVGIRMAVSGTLAVRVHRLEASLAQSGGPEARYGIRLAVGDNVHDTRFAPVGHNKLIEINEALHYDMQATAESEEVTIEVLQQDQAKPLVSARRSLKEFVQDSHDSKMTFMFGPVSAPNTMHLVFSADWTPAEQSSTKTLAAAETHRPWFMRASYYYETTKSVYDYTTSFRVVKPFARLGEATVNTVLATVSGKTLYDVDQSLVVPVLDSMDNKVDATISVAFTKLYEGQQMAVRTKDRAVRAVSNVAHKTGSTVVGAANYTTHKVASATGAVYGTVTGVADYASSQVVHASSSTYGAVRGVTYSVARHIPILGPKIRA